MDTEEFHMDYTTKLGKYLIVHCIYNCFSGKNMLAINAK